MKFEVLVHGVPYGQDYWGPDFDRSYAAPFYNTSENGLQYVVETRKADEENYCYYTYARYGNVLDCEGRRGSYVAVTYRFDMLYTDVKRVFQILETVFEKSIVGSIIEYSGTNYKFLCRSLKEKEDVMKKVEDDTLKLLQLSVLNDKLLSIDDAFIHQNVAKATFNIVDCTESNILSALKQVSKVIATPDAPDARDKTIAQRNEEIAQLKVNLDAEKKGRRKDNEAWKKKIDDIKTDEKLIAENEQLQNDVLNLQHKVENYKLTLDKLRKKMRVSMGVILSLLALSLGGLAYLKFIAPQQLGPVPVGYVSQLEYDKLQQKNTELELALKTNDTSGVLEQYQKDQSYLKQKIDSLKQENDDLKQEISKFQQGKEITDPSRKEEYPDVNKLKIDLKGVSSLEVGKQNTVRILCDDEKFSKRDDDNKKIYNGNGTWEVSGFEIEETEDDPAIATIKPLELKSNETYKITFKLGNGDTVVRPNTKQRLDVVNKKKR
jgi:uncharacterized protein YlxW (UPF0749 family)